MRLIYLNIIKLYNYKVGYRGFVFGFVDCHDFAQGAKSRNDGVERESTNPRFALAMTK